MSAVRFCTVRALISGVKRGPNQINHAEFLCPSGKTCLRVLSRSSAVPIQSKLPPRSILKISNRGTDITTQRLDYPRRLYGDGRTLLHVGHFFKESVCLLCRLNDVRADGASLHLQDGQDKRR